MVLVVVVLSVLVVFGQVLGMIAIARHPVQLGLLLAIVVLLLAYSLPKH